MLYERGVALHEHCAACSPTPSCASSGWWSAPAARSRRSPIEPERRRPAARRHRAGRAAALDSRRHRGRGRGRITGAGGSAVLVGHSTPVHQEHHVAILPTLRGPADLRGLSDRELTALAAEIRETIIDTVADDRRPPRQLARRRRAHDRPPPAARVAARPDRLGHRPPGLPPQAADRPLRAVRDAAPARRRRRLPAPQRVRARRLRRRPRRHRPVDRRRGSRRRATCAAPHERIAVVVGDAALMSGLSLEALNDIGQRQTQMLIVLNDNEMSISPTVGALSKYLSTDQAVARPGGRARRAYDELVGRMPVVGPTALELSPRLPQVGRELRPARPAVRGPRDHLHRRRARPRPAGAPADVPPGARAARAGDRPRPDAEGPRLPAGRGRPGRLPRRGPAADDRSATTAGRRQRRMAAAATPAHGSDAPARCRRESMADDAAPPAGRDEEAAELHRRLRRAS